MKERLRIAVIGLCLLLLLQGCASLLAGEYADESSLRKYFSQNESLFATSAKEIMEELVPNTDRRYRIRQSTESAQELTPYTAGAPSVFRNQTLRQLFDGKVIDQILTENSVVLYCCTDVNAAKGIAYVPSDRPQDIFFYREDMEFRTKGSGYLGTEPGTDNTFFYARIKENWYYFEVQN